MPYTIKNSSAKNNYFAANGGAAITATTQPQVKFGTLNGVLDSSLAKAADVGLVSTTPIIPYTGYDRANIMLTYTPTMRGTSSTVLRTAGADYNRPSLDKVRHMRTNRVGTLIRGGYWHMTSGVFSNSGAVINPTNANDFSAVGTDDEGAVSRAAPGEFAYAYKPIPTYTGYKAKTQ